jgi:hypothetical protein
MDYLLPFLLDEDDDPDMNRSDRHAAIERDWQQQRVIDAWLRGEYPYEAVLDFVADQGVDAYDYDDAIADGVDRLVASNVLVDCAGYPLTQCNGERSE